MKKLISIMITVSIILSITPVPQVYAGATRPAEITQPTDEFSPYRESKNFLFDIPSSYLRGQITPAQLGWYLGEMDKLYDALADFVGGANGWLPRSYYETGHKTKILMNYDPNLSNVMNAYLGRPQMNFSPIAVSETVDNIRRGQVFHVPVHELGHNFSASPILGILQQFNAEWTADFLMIYASIATGIALGDTNRRMRGGTGKITTGTFDEWYQLEYDWQALEGLDWSFVLTHSTRHASIITCAILNFVRDHGWGSISKAFGSYNDFSFTRDEQRYEAATFDAILFNDFIDRIDYFSGIDFRDKYLDYKDWLEYVNETFPAVCKCGKCNRCIYTKIKVINNLFGNIKAKTNLKKGSKAVGKNQSVIVINNPADLVVTVTELLPGGVTSDIKEVMKVVLEQLRE